MAQTLVNIRMDENLKKDFDNVCSELGMSMTTAVKPTASMQATSTMLCIKLQRRSINKVFPPFNFSPEKKSPRFLGGNFISPVNPNAFWFLFAEPTTNK